MLLADRQSALRQRNASAAISASTKIADLLLRQAEEEAVKAAPITQLTHRIIHVTVCERCKERGAISDTPPPSPEPEAAKPRRACGWDDASPNLHPPTPLSTGPPAGHYSGAETAENRQATRPRQPDRQRFGLTR